jgi:hypothetical protein
MESQIVKIDATDWSKVQGRDEWTAAVEAGKVLYFPQLSFQLSEQEKTLLRPDVRDPKTRNISLNVDGSIKGVAGDEATQAQVAAMVGRFREQATALIAGLFPPICRWCAWRPPATALRRWKRGRSPGVPTTSACMWMPFLRGPTMASAFCASSPMSTRMASPGSGVWASRSPMWPSVLCRVPSPTAPGRPRRWSCCM